MAPTPNPAELEWYCEAYGPELDALYPAGAPHCFFELLRTCENKGTCMARLSVERMRLFARLLVGAQHGDEVCIMLLDDIGYDHRKLLRATEES